MIGPARWLVVALVAAITLPVPGVEGTTPAEIEVINQKLRKAIENEGQLASIEGLWWQYSLTERTAKEPSGIFYYWKGERPLDPNVPQLEGTGKILLESAGRASGYWTTRAEGRQKVNARTSGVYLRAEPEDLGVLDGRDDRRGPDGGAAEELGAAL